MNRVLGVLAAAFVLGCDTPSSTGGGGGTTPPPQVDPRIAAPELVVNGQYSDVRFIDMMAAHHQGAIETATVERDMGAQSELIELAKMMIEAQSAEIERLRAIKEANFGSRDLPTMMNPRQMANSGGMSGEELSRMEDVDKAFIDSMMPHHAGAIQMATVAARRSGLPALRDMAREIIDAQAKEIGELGELRVQWYGDAPVD